MVEGDGEDMTPSDECLPTDTGHREVPASRGDRRDVRRRPSSRQGSSPNGEDPQGLRKPPQAARRARPEGRRHNRHWERFRSTWNEKALFRH